MLLSHGFEVLLGEPDLIFGHAGQHLGIAAKRPSSLRQVEKRFRKAMRQLDQAGMRGFVAVSLDRLIATGDPRIFARTPDALSHAAETCLEHVRDTIKPFIQPLLRDVAPLGVLFSLTISGFLPRRGYLGVNNVLQVTPNPLCSYSYTLSWEVYRRLEARVTCPQLLYHPQC